MPSRISTALCALLAAAVLVASAAGAGAGPAPGGASARGADAHRVKRPPTRFDPIPYGRARKHQMAGYSERHYGRRSWRLGNVRALVLHYTAGPSYESAWNTFASNAPALGELPGVCAQFVVDKDGTIYQLTRIAVRCRHTIGLNHLSIGIEMVQEDLGGSHATAQAILAREKQARAAVRLAAWLKQRDRIAMNNVIGHAMANDSRLFKDLQGWRNDHVDWRAKEVGVFRSRMRRLLHPRAAG